MLLTAAITPQSANTRYTNGARRLSQILDVRRIGRPVRVDAASHELTAALQHRSDAGAIPLPMMHRFEVQPTVHP